MDEQNDESSITDVNSKKDEQAFNKKNILKRNYVRLMQKGEKNLRRNGKNVLIN